MSKCSVILSNRTALLDVDKHQRKKLKRQLRFRNTKWKKVPGYEIEVNKYGEVRDSVSKVLKKQSIRRKGYKCVGARCEAKNYRNRTVSVHRMIAIVFVKGYKEKLQVNHKDLNKGNNFYKNLEWVTNRQNIRHAINNGIEMKHCGESHGRAKLNWKKVKRIRKLRKEGKTLEYIANHFKVCIRTIALICKHEIWKRAR